MFRDIEDPQLDLHFNIPMTIGGPGKQAFQEPLVPGLFVDSIRAAQPENPGMVPLTHLPISNTLDAYRLAVPYIKANATYEETLGAVSQLFGEVAFDDDFDEAAEEQDLSFAQSIEPLFIVILQFAIAIGTLLFLSMEIRYAIVWWVMTLLGAFFTLTDRSEPLEPVQSSDLGWGLGLGVVVGLPLLIILRPSLTSLTQSLFPEIGLPTLVLFLLLAVPLGETLLFRGMVQERRGYLVSILAAGLSTLLIFWPALRTVQVGLAVFVVIFLTGMAAMYGYVRFRYGLASALACQVAVHLLLMLLPVVFA